MVAVSCASPKAVVHAPPGIWRWISTRSWWGRHSEVGEPPRHEYDAVVIRGSDAGGCETTTGGPSGRTGVGGIAVALVSGGTRCGAQNAGSFAGIVQSGTAGPASMGLARATNSWVRSGPAGGR